MYAGKIYVNDRQVKQKHVYWGLDRTTPRTHIRISPLETCDVPSDFDSYLGNSREKVSVGKWLKSEDFSMVCDLGSLNAEEMSKLVKEILTSKPVVARYLGERLRRVIQNKIVSI